MKLTKFSPPANVDDFKDSKRLDAYSDHVSELFDSSVSAVRRVLKKFHAGKSQFYNPVTHGHTEPDTLKDIVWNGFPRRFVPGSPGQATDFAAAEPDKLQSQGGIQFRQQDEYLEWFVHRDAVTKKITRVDFTCEAYDYFDFLAGEGNPAAGNKQSVIDLYKTFVAPGATQEELEAELFPGGGRYNPWNAYNTEKGAMHLTHPANALGAEIKLAADATVRRDSAGKGEPKTAAALIQCAQFGGAERNSDPKIGFEVNTLARAGFMITLTDPVGLYMVAFDDAGWQFSDGTPASGFMKILRGKEGKAIRASYELPAALTAQGKTISDIMIGGVPIQFGGQIAEHITMGIQGAACLPGSINNKLVPCGQIPTFAAVPNALLTPVGRVP